MTWDISPACRETPVRDLLSQDTAPATIVMSQDIGDRPNLRVRSVSRLGLGLGLVVPDGVEGELAEEFSGGLGDDADVQVLDEQEDVGSGVGSSDADVVEPAVDAQCDDAVTPRRTSRCGVAG